MSTKDLINEVKGNINADRERLTDLYDSIKKLTTIQGQEDLLALATVSENLVKITDSLTKQNSQLVDLAKLKQKIESEKVPSNVSASGFSETDTQDVFDEIEKPNN